MASDESTERIVCGEYGWLLDDTRLLVCVRSFRHRGVHEFAPAGDVNLRVTLHGTYATLRDVEEPPKSDPKKSVGRHAHVLATNPDDEEPRCAICGMHASDIAEQEFDRDAEAAQDRMYEQEHETREYDPGPEVDDEGGMSEYRNETHDDPEG